MDWKTIYKELMAGNWITLLILSSAGYFLLSPAQALGIIIGGLIIIANFKVFQHAIRKAFSHDGLFKASRASVIIRYYIRIMILGIIIFVLIWRGWVEVVGLAIGLSTVIISIFALGVRTAMKVYAREASH